MALALQKQVKEQYPAQMTGDDLRHFKWVFTEVARKMFFVESLRSNKISLEKMESDWNIPKEEWERAAVQFKKLKSRDFKPEDIKREFACGTGEVKYVFFGEGAKTNYVPAAKNNESFFDGCDKIKDLLKWRA